MSTTTDSISWADLKAMILAHSEQLRETDRLMKETDRRLQETDRLMKETDRRLLDTDRRLQRTDAGIDALRRELGRLGNRMGDFVEGFVEPTVVELFRQRGLPVHQVIRRLEALDDAGECTDEVDLLVVNSEVGVAVECKSHAGVPEVREHLQRMQRFKTAFPRFADLRLQGAVAAMNWTREAQRFAYRQGLWVLAQNERVMRVQNDARFAPKEW